MSGEGTRIAGSISEPANRVVQALVTLGLPMMSVDELAAATGIPATDVRTAVAALVIAGRLIPHRTGWYALASAHQCPHAERGELQDIRTRFGEYLLRRVRAMRNQVTAARKVAPKERQHCDVSPTPLAAGPLSKREAEVLELIADGLENRSIAKLLFVSVETVRTHVKNILRKLAANDRTHAVAVAFRTGLLPATTFTREQTSAGT